MITSLKVLLMNHSRNVHVCISSSWLVFEGDSNRKLLLQSLCGRSLHLIQLLWAGLLLSLETVEVCGYWL